MRTINHNLPGVKRLGVLDRRKLPPQVSLMGLCQMKVGILTEVYELPFYGTPELKVITKRENGGKYQEVNLSFTGEILPNGLLDKVTAFVVEMMDGETYLIGSNERPVVQQWTELGGYPGGESRAATCEARYVAICGFVRCDVSKFEKIVSK